MISPPTTSELLAEKNSTAIQDTVSAVNTIRDWIKKLCSDLKVMQQKMSKRPIPKSIEKGRGFRKFHYALSKAATITVTIHISSHTMLLIVINLESLPPGKDSYKRPYDDHSLPVEEENDSNIDNE